jgi:hypothetical protein
VGEPILSYEAALSRAGAGPTLLLGNGFSIAYSLDFAYEQLRELAPLPPELDAAFDDLETANFEEVLRWFAVSRRILERLDLAAGISDDLVEHERQVRQAMIHALTRANPRSFADMSNSERSCAQTFLKPYGNIFTLCYDLLLYWLIARAKRKDAFWPRDEGAFRWDATTTCEVHWLHGGFHLYEQGADTYKVVQKGGGTERALLDKIEENIRHGIIPHIVAEGRAEQKRIAIAGNSYLETALQRLTSTEGSIVTFGASFRQDAHILEAIVRGRADQLFIGVHGSRGHAQFIDLYDDVAADRERWTKASGLPSRPLHVAFWDTTSDQIVWGRPPHPHADSKI